MRMRKKDFSTQGSGGVRYFSLFVRCAWVYNLLYKETLLKGNLLFYSDILSDFVSCWKWIYYRI